MVPGAAATVGQSANPVRVDKEKMIAGKSVFAAVPFYFGQHQAQELAPDIELSREPSWLEKIFMAVTFAESGLPYEATRMMRPAPAKARIDAKLAKDLGLKGIQLKYGSVSA